MCVSRNNCGSVTWNPSIGISFLRLPSWTANLWCVSVMERLFPMELCSSSRRRVRGRRLRKKPIGIQELLDTGEPSQGGGPLRVGYRCCCQPAITIALLIESRRGISRCEWPEATTIIGPTSIECAIPIYRIPCDRVGEGPARVCALSMSEPVNVKILGIMQ